MSFLSKLAIEILFLEVCRLLQSKTNAAKMTKGVATLSYLIFVASIGTFLQIIDITIACRPGWQCGEEDRRCPVLDTDRGLLVAVDKHSGCPVLRQ